MKYHSVTTRHLKVGKMRATHYDFYAKNFVDFKIDAKTSKWKNLSDQKRQRMSYWVLETSNTLYITNSPAQQQLN
jgi:hypothetical protein